ncbi:hemerythrin family protein [Campylobacter volucris]|uniref:bacteriohemerythrin n=1 Tax=Campylobacter volucris TaxID=1031542 RepID=UPI00189FFF3C|nr:hemerythrin family protein [Campylobacter volucris]MBF7067804.1 hemerythrin family protein [Campylobacter volucris]
MLPEWDQKYSVNNENLDAQHQKLFKLAAKVEEMSDRAIYQIELKKIIADFFHYIKFHFDEEENYMQQINYPYIDQHKLMHKKITNTMVKLIKEVKTTNDLKEKLNTIVSSWLIEHIIQHDVMIEHWYKSTQDNNKNSNNLKEENKTNFFLYRCACEGKKHKVSYDIHLKIQYTKANFKCKECANNLTFYKDEEILA